MPWRAPPSLTPFCREILPLLREQTRGERLLRTLAPPEVLFERISEEIQRDKSRLRTRFEDHN